MTQTRRWRGIIAVTLLVGGIGVIADRPALVLVAVVGVTFSVYPRLAPDPPSSPSLALERHVSDAAPAPRAPVEVTVTVRNTGDTVLSDVRLVDGVPAALTVTDGSPRYGGPLRPGGEATFQYVVEAEAGDHWFEPATAVVRDLSGADEITTTVTAETEIDCTATAASPPKRNTTIEDAGDVLTDQGGSGLVFHQTRAYRRGDPMSRIDWTRFARGGDLATVEFREEQPASIVLLIDVRAAAYRAAEDDSHAVVQSLTAAQRLTTTLLTGRDRVGIAALGPETCWLAPSTGAAHRLQATRLLATHPAFATSPPRNADVSIDDQLARLRQQLRPEMQVTFFTPLCDAGAVTAATSLEAHGHAVTVVSPAATGDATPGRRLATLERSSRIAALRQRGIPVVDWAGDDQLAVALAKADKRGAL